MNDTTRDVAMCRAFDKYYRKNWPLCQQAIDEGKADSEITDEREAQWDTWQAAWQAALLSACSVPVAEGWQLVPIEPTHPMVGAGARAILAESERKPHLNSLDMVKASYPAMLAATPSAPAQPEQHRALSDEQWTDAIRKHYVSLGDDEGQGVHPYYKAAFKDGVNFARALLASSPECGSGEAPIHQIEQAPRRWTDVDKFVFDHWPAEKRTVYATPPAQPAQDERGAFEDWWYAKINSGETPLDIAFGMHAEHIKARASSPAPSGAARDVLDAKKVREIAEGWHMHKATTVEDIEGAINDALTEIERIGRATAKGGSDAE
jgi:hypothetical protein